MSTILSYRNIHVDSDCFKFRVSVFAMLKQLESRPIGNELIDRIHSCGHCIIVQDSNDRSEAIPQGRRNETAKGCSTTIKFYNRTVSAFSRTGQCIDLPPFICLAHELIHALHYAHDTAKMGVLDSIWTSEEELYTIEGDPNEEGCITENAIRREWGLAESYGHLAYEESYRQLTCFESRFREIEWVNGTPLLKRYTPRLQRRFEQTLIPVLTSDVEDCLPLEITPQFLLSMLPKYPEAWKFAGKWVRKNNAFWINAVKIQKRNKALLLQALKLGHYNAFYYACKETQADSEVLTLAPPEANSNRELMLDLLRINPQAWKWAGIDLYGDVSYWVEAVLECPCDQELIMKAHNHTRGASTKYADPGVVSDLELKEFSIRKRKR